MFFRCHHSYLINLHHVRKYLKNENQIEMTNGKKVDLSRRKKEEFLKRMMPE
jgi:two-component system LytT family response regulator